jgi:hypothetical protein
MGVLQGRIGPNLIDERDPADFRTLFGRLLAGSSVADTAIFRVRLGAVDLSNRELGNLHRLRVLVAEANAHTVEGEAYALAVDPLKRDNLSRVLTLLQKGVMELRSAPLGGWSPDFTVFSNHRGPQHLLLGLHWFHRPFPYRGPAWAVRLGVKEASRAADRFQELWEGAHDIGPAIRRLMEETVERGSPTR